MKNDLPVAYFSMEIAFETNVPNYAGGLGVLAADMLMSAADLDFKMVGVSLLYHQNDDIEDGFRAERYLTRLPQTTEVQIEDRRVKVAIWKKEIFGRTGAIVPIYFLSTYLPENQPWDRDITKHLYANDRYTRLCQEIVLGIGGVRALEVLGYPHLQTYHLNEGHAAFCTLELLRRYHYNESDVRSRVTFTTHTPIAAGHDYFDYALAGNTLREMMPWNIRDLAGQNNLGMTELAMNLSHSTNSVSERHRQVCAAMFPGRQINNVTNGVYPPRWAGEHLTQIYNTYLPGWDENPSLLGDALAKLPTAKWREAKQLEKKALTDWINLNKSFFAVSNVSENDSLDTDTLTIGFARRFVPYKRPDLLFRDLNGLATLGDQKLQVIFANRCHPDDFYCNDLHSKLEEYANKLRDKIKIVLIPDYDLDIAKRLVAGCDMWLNTPRPPLEASGTSGMKAALNGALNLSVADGWWIEGLAREPGSGWHFGDEGAFATPESQDSADAAALLQALGQAMRCYYERPDEWAERSKRAISLLSFFNTSRVINEYNQKIWSS